MAIELPDEVVSGGGPFSTYEDSQLGYIPSTKTVANVMTAVRRMFGDEAGVQVQDSDIIDWINDGQDTIVNRNRILKSRAFTNSIVGIAQYRYPDDQIEQVESIHYNGVPIKSISFAQAEQEIRYWDSTPPIDPVIWWEWAGSFTLWPAPPAPAPIVIYYTLRPQPIKNASDLLSIPDKYFQTLVNYCLQQAYELDSDWQAAQQKQSQFEAAVNAFGEEERTGEHMTYETVTDVDDWYSNGPDWI
jgi:hypothetical protein